MPLTWRRGCSMQRNITLTVEDDPIRKVRVLAVRRNHSVSALLREELSRLVAEDEAYEKAKRAALECLKRGSHLSGVLIPPETSYTIGPAFFDAMFDWSQCPAIERTADKVNGRLGLQRHPRARQSPFRELGRRGSRRGFPELVSRRDPRSGGRSSRLHQAEPSPRPGLNPGLPSVAPGGLSNRGPGGHLLASGSLWHLFK